MEENTPKVVKLLIFFGVLSLFVITGFYIYSEINGTNISLELSKILPVAGKENDYGYNFIIPEVSATSESLEENSTQENPEIESEVAPTETKEDVASEDKVLSEEQIDFALDSNAAEALVGSIIIPKIDINSSIFSGSDGTVLMDKGFWVYPSSFSPGEGEMILICHRRFFGERDPRSCWRLHLLQKGDLIQVNNPEGKPIRYQVTTVSVRDPQDVDIFSVSESKTLTIVSCSLPSGLPGGSTNRIVVSADQI